MIQIPPLITPVAKPLIMPRKYPASMDPSCVAYYEFSRGPKLQDYSGKGNHGTITGGTTVAKGRHHTAMLFDGIDDIISCGNDASLDLTELTIETWLLCFGGTSDHQVIVGRAFDGETMDMSYFMQFLPDLEVQLVKYDGAEQALSSDKLNTNQWYHIVGTWKDTAMKLYIDTVMIETTYAAGIDASIAPLTIGAWTKTGDVNPFNGLIDTIRIYNRELNANEITRLYETER